MVFTFIDEKGEAKKLGKEKPSQPIKAAARSGVQHFLGSYGDVASLIPGYKNGQTLPGQQSRARLESQASDSNLAALSADSDIAPEYGTLPTSEQVSKLLDMLGIKKKEDTRAEQAASRFGRLFGGSASLGPAIGLPAALSTAATATAAGEGVKALGGGGTLQSIAEILSSLRLSGKDASKAATRINQPRVVTKNIPPSEAGFISPERLQKQLNRVNSEASKLAKNIGTDHPVFQQISKSIASDHPIQKHLNSALSGLEETAKHFNPPVNAQPLEKFLQNEASRYAGTGAPTQLGKFIQGEIQGWQQAGKNDLYSLFRRYRLNNERFKEILSEYKPGEMRSQMLGFLSRMNDSIKDSFRQTFKTQSPVPQGSKSLASEWLNGFEETNRAYSNWINTKQVRSILDPILSKNVTDQQLQKFVRNKNNWEDINRFLGPEEGGKIKQLTEDILKARDALQNFKVKDASAAITQHVLTAAVLKLGKLSALLSVPKAWQWARGMYNSSPAFQQNFHELTQALIEKNVPAINRAIKSIESEKSEKKKINFIPENKK